MAEAGASVDAEALVKAVFEKWDVDKDSGLTPSELSTLLNDCDAEYWTSDRAQALLTTIDANKDGVINMAEFVQFVLSPGSGEAERKLVLQLQAAVGSTSVDPKALKLLQFSTLSGTVFSKAVDMGTKVSQLKQIIAGDCGIPPMQQELICGDTKLVGSLPISDIGVRTSDLPEEPLSITVIRKSKRSAFLCAEALKDFTAKNLSEYVINVSVSGNREQAIAPGESWKYAKIDFWDGRYFDCDFTNGGGVSENQEDPSYTIKARAEDESEEWHLRFNVKGYHCSAVPC